MSKKPLGRKNYGSIPHLLGSKLGSGDHHIHEGQHRILTENIRDLKDLITITEKMDGSNVGVAKINNRIVALSRSGYECNTSKYKQHHDFEKWVNQPSQLEKFYNFLDEGERIAGEWCLKTHGLKYEIKVDPFFAFDYFDSSNKRRSWWDLKNKCHDYNIETVHEIFTGCRSMGISFAWKILKNKLDFRFNSDYVPEGMVYRCERNNKFDFMAKWVRGDFQPGIFMNEELYNT